MNRTLTAAVALAASLGMAGLAQAQMNTSPATPSSPAMSPNTGSGMTGAPAGAENPSMMGTPGANSTTGASNPQASTQPGQMGQGGQQSSQAQIQQAQQQLKTQGLYRGTVDGVMGPETQTALSKFQQKQGLPQTAQLDPQTMSALMGQGGAGANGAGPTGTQQPSDAGSTMTPGAATTPNR